MVTISSLQYIASRMSRFIDLLGAHHAIHTALSNFNAIEESDKAQYDLLMELIAHVSETLDSSKFEPDDYAELESLEFELLGRALAAALRLGLLQPVKSESEKPNEINYL